MVGFPRAPLRPLPQVYQPCSPGRWFYSLGLFGLGSLWLSPCSGVPPPPCSGFSSPPPPVLSPEPRGGGHCLTCPGPTRRGLLPGAKFCLAPERASRGSSSRECRRAGRTGVLPASDRRPCWAGRRKPPWTSLIAVAAGGRWWWRGDSHAPAPSQLPAARRRPQIPGPPAPTFLLPRLREVGSVTLQT